MAFRDVIPEKPDGVNRPVSLFLPLIHLAGNLQLLLPAEVAQRQFNFYSKLLSENIFIYIISYLLFAAIIAHSVYALVITIKTGAPTESAMNMIDAA